MAYLDRIRECNGYDPAEFMPFRVGGEVLGAVRPGFAAALDDLRADFAVRADGLHWVGAPAGFEARTESMQALCAELEQRGLVGPRHGERYPVTAGRRESARFLIDRACAPYFGVRAFGQHLNGCVRRDGGLWMWVARRAADRRVYPNRLDNMVAGGLPWELTLEANLHKECREEAGIPGELAARAVPVGAISYCGVSDRGVKPDVMYCYDLELPADFEPRCEDGEVAGFHLWPVERVARTVHDGTEFKLNCNLVIIDFLIRHGVLTPAHPDYLAIVHGLRALR